MRNNTPQRQEEIRQARAAAGRKGGAKTAAIPGHMARAGAKGGRTMAATPGALSNAGKIGAVRMHRKEGHTLRPELRDLYPETAETPANG